MDTTSHRNTTRLPSYRPFARHPAGLGYASVKRRGTGIGLTVSARIAREHGGWIGVVTQDGRGSTFTVYLPPIAPAAA
jgi:signal transduction histidine kinase